NMDVSSFAKDFKDFIPDSRALLVENVEDGPNQLDTPSSALKALMGPVKFLGEFIGPNSPSGKNRIFHSVNGEVDSTALAAKEFKALENIAAMSQYFRANASAVALVTALHVAEGGDVKASITKLLHRNFTLKPHKESALTLAGKTALQETKKDILMTDQVAGYLLTSLGSDGIEKLAKLSAETGIVLNEKMKTDGMETKEKAIAFLDKAKDIFESKRVSFGAIKHDLTEGMHAKPLPAITADDYAKKAQESRGKLDKQLNSMGSTMDKLMSGDWKKAGWAKAESA
ncbi:MAG: hypothetical protein K2Q01_01175, partial [Rickettsiales bacterium]|nr:hypothetical protein [Rickettsiales bacterium]